MVLCIAVVWAFLLHGCKGFEEDNSHCGLDIRVVYEYNMDYTNRMQPEVNNINLFIFDSSTGVLVRHIEINSPSQLDNNFSLHIDGLKPGVYDILVWGNLNNNFYNFADIFNAHNARLANLVTLKSNDLKEVEVLPGTLFHGILSNVAVKQVDNEKQTVSLIKNTNNVNITIIGLPMVTPVGGGACRIYRQNSI